MRTIILVHWKKEELGSCAARLKREGYRVMPTDFQNSAGLRAMGENPPTAVVIDLPRRRQRDKKSAGLEKRQALHSRHVVDYKVCAIDDTWSGLKFARRKK